MEEQNLGANKDTGVRRGQERSGMDLEFFFPFLHNTRTWREMFRSQVWSRQKEVLFHTTHNYTVEIIATGCHGGQKYK